MTSSEPSPPSGEMPKYFSMKTGDISVLRSLLGDLLTMAALFAIVG